MKFLVDSLPYYGEDCPMMMNNLCNLCMFEIYRLCPREWDKEFVCSDDNPHECPCLKEIVKK